MDAVIPLLVFLVAGLCVYGLARYFSGPAIIRRRLRRAALSTIAAFPDGGVAQEERSFIRASGGYTRTLTNHLKSR